VERIRLVGFLKFRVDSSGGAGRGGQLGTGIVFAGGSRFFRGCNFGRRSRRFGIAEEGFSFKDGGGNGMVSVLEGILLFVWFEAPSLRSVDGLIKYPAASEN